MATITSVYLGIVRQVQQKEKHLDLKVEGLEPYVPLLKSGMVRMQSYYDSITDETFQSQLKNEIESIKPVVDKIIKQGSVSSDSFGDLGRALDKGYKAHSYVRIRERDNGTPNTKTKKLDEFLVSLKNNKPNFNLKAGPSAADCPFEMDASELVIDDNNAFPVNNTGRKSNQVQESNNMKILSTLFLLGFALTVQAGPAVKKLKGIVISYNKKEVLFVSEGTRYLLDNSVLKYNSVVSLCDQIFKDSLR